MFAYFAVSCSRLTLKISTKNLIFWVLLLVAYRSVNDIFLHKLSAIQSFYEILKQSFPVLLLAAIEYLEIEDEKIIKTIFLASFIQITVGLFQVYNPSFTMNIIFDEIPLVRAPEITRTYLLEMKRITGTFDISIGYALLIGIFMIIAISEYFKNRSKIYIVTPYVLLCGILIVFTGTRSAIYGIIPSIMLAYFIYSKPRLKRILAYSIVAILAIASFRIIERGITYLEPRAKVQIDGNTYLKLASNIYGTYGALKENPLFGIPQSEHLSYIYKGVEDLGEIIPAKKHYSLVDTHHNIIGTYIKYYGLVGLVIFLSFVATICKKINLKSDRNIKFMLYGVLIYILQYAMLHNNMLLNFFPLWILLAVGEEEVEKVKIKFGT